MQDFHKISNWLGAVLVQVQLFSTWVKVQVTWKKATQVEVKYSQKNVLEVQVQSKYMYLKYRQKYFIDLKPFNMQICFYSDAMSGNCGLVAYGDCVWQRLVNTSDWSVPAIDILETMSITQCDQL